MIWEVAAGAIIAVFALAMTYGGFVHAAEASESGDNQYRRLEIYLSTGLGLLGLFLCGLICAKAFHLVPQFLAAVAWIVTLGFLFWVGIGLWRELRHPSMSDAEAQRAYQVQQRINQELRKVEAAEGVAETKPSPGTPEFAEWANREGRWSEQAVAHRLQRAREAAGLRR